MNDEDRLVARCQQGDPAAFDQLMERYQNRIYRLALVILRHEGEALDATQESFLRALRAIEKYRGASSFETWLIAIARNVCRDRLRRQRVRRALSLEALTPRWLARLARREDRPEAQFEARQQQQTVWSLVDELDDRLRLPLILRYQYDYSCAEIAPMLGIATKTVYGRLSEGRRLLRQRMDEGELPFSLAIGEAG